MASKSKAATAAKAKIQSHSTNSSRKGLHYTAAQWKAYNKASAARYKSLSQQISANTFRKGRLNSAYAHMAKQRAANLNAARASIAAYAVKRTYQQAQYSTQNAALRRRIGADLVRHNILFGRAQFAQSGQRKWTQRAILRTVTNKQALLHVQQAAAARQAKKGANTPAANRSSGSRTSGPTRSAATKAALRMAARQAGMAAAAKVSAQSAKAPAAKKTATKSRTADRDFQGIDWLQQPEKGCIVTAIANSLLFHTGIRMTHPQLARFFRHSGGSGATIGLALMMARNTGGWEGWIPEYKRVDEPEPGDVIGYESEYGPHAAMYLGNGRVATWGDEEDLTDDVEEVWSIRWVAKD